MLDLTRFDPKRLSDRDAARRQWEVDIERKAQAAQDEVDRVEVIDGGPRRRPQKLLGAPPPPPH